MALWIRPVFAFLFGLCVGSFLNVCAWRIPRGESIVSPPSKCPKCDRPIRWYENIPLLSWLALRGRCRGCREPISIRYFLIELATGLLFAAVYVKIDSLGLPRRMFAAELTASLAVASLAVVATVTDIEHRIIPNKTTYPVIFLGLALAAVAPENWDMDSRLTGFAFSCASVTACAGAMLLVSIFGKMAFKKDALGLGDVKFIAAVAAALGPRAAFFTLFAGSVVGALAGLALMAVRKKGPKMAISFGPALAFGAVLWIFIGREVWHAYFAFLERFHGGHSVSLIAFLRGF